MDRRQAFFVGKRWGLFTHFLANPAGNSVDRPVSAEEWNREIDNFNVPQLAKQIKETGADYFCITIGQNTGHYCSPNSTYDRFVQISPSKCSKRDLVLELARELKNYGVAAWVYLPSGAPCAEPQAVKNLKWEDGQWDPAGKRNHCKPLEEFQGMWEQVIREWSLRWGDLIQGWWIDGCYFPEDMYQREQEPNFHSFARALRAGNENAVLCFNKGLEDPFALQSDEDDFTAGEVSCTLPLGTDYGDSMEGLEKKLGGKKFHILSYLGETWGGGKPRFPNELAAGYTKYIADKGGIITWDIRIERQGRIPDSFMQQLKAINSAL